jgi:hypothetical protein
MKEAYMQRVIDERDDLVGKIERLTAFIESNPIYVGLPDEDRFLLAVQCTAMKVYAEILNRRIALTIQSS